MTDAESDAAGDPTVIAGRRRKAARLSLRGLSQAKIARRLGCSQSTVSRDLEAVRAAWLADATLAMDAIKAKELAKLDELEATYWRAWERSVGEHTKTTVTDKATGAETSTTTEDLCGDPRYLAGVERCVERRCKIPGLDAPKRFDGSLTVPVKVVAGIDLERL
jgi:predicted transcriptional regulator